MGGMECALYCTTKSLRGVCTMRVVDVCDTQAM